MRQLPSVGPRLIEHRRGEDFSLAVLEGVSEVASRNDLNLDLGYFANLPVFEVGLAAHFFPHKFLEFSEGR